MSYLLEREIWSNVFAVPTGVVDQQLRLCSDVALRVLLLLLRHGGKLEESEICALLGPSVSLSMVQDALLYWEQEGVLTPRQQPTSTQSDSSPPPTLLVPPIPALPVEPEVPLPDAETTRKIKTLTSSRTRLSSKEIGEMARNDENIAFLLQESQSVLGRPLTPVMTDTITALYSYYGMQPDLVLMMLQYCVTMGKDNMRYVEKVAATWLENGVDTHEKAEQQILQATERSSIAGKIKSAFGIFDRKLIASEQKYIETWTEQFGFDLDLISMAFERAVEQKGALSFPYINGILSNWHAKGVHTLEQAEQEIRQKSTKSASSAGSASYDMQELETLITYQDLVP